LAYLVTSEVLDSANMSSSPILDKIKLTTATFGKLKEELKKALIVGRLLEQTDSKKASDFIDSDLLNNDEADFTISDVERIKIINAVVIKLQSMAFNSINKLITDKYTIPYITGKKGDQARDVLISLKNGQVSEQEMTLFKYFADVRTKTTTGTWESCSVSDIDTTNLENFRINLKTIALVLDTGKTTKTLKIVEYLPLLQAKNRLCYNVSSVVPNDPADESLLRKVFHEFYSSDSPTLIYDFDKKASIHLQPDIEKLVKHILSNEEIPSASIDPDNAEEIDSVLKGSWERVDTNTWKKRMDDRSYVLIKTGTKEFDEDVAKQTRNCGAYGFAKDPVKCAEFLKSVANNNSSKLAELAEQMDEAVTTQAVQSVNPRLAMAILKTYGFRRKMCMDKVAGRQLEKYQSVNEWLETFVDKKFQSKEASSIKANKKIQNLLKLLVQLINSNPSILNDGMIVDTEESTGMMDEPSLFKERKIRAVSSHRTTKPVLLWNDIQKNMNTVYGNFSKGLNFSGPNANLPFGMDNLFPSMLMPTSAVNGNVVRGSTWGTMFGGSAGSERTYMGQHPTRGCYTDVQGILGKLVFKMNATNAFLNEKDRKTIATKISEFEKLETELHKYALNIQKLTQLRNLQGVENRKEMVSLEQIDRLVEKYNSVAQRHERTGNSFQTLISLIQECTGDDASEHCTTLG
jgi:ribosomal protein S13